MKNAFVAQRRVVSALYFLHTRGGLMFDIPSAKREAERAADGIAALICSAE